MGHTKLTRARALKEVARLRALLDQAYEQLGLEPMTRAAHILSRAANVDERDVLDALNAIARGDYSVQAAQLIALLVREVERCSRRGSHERR